ncbi:hypothetical protein F5Y15DRAFT_417942 [Xylariaceae sp. FL0016]|nr:hypothetical protein F5Y15DRAFT_417942 [Xylariaceae sp. FL0016]
MPPRQSSSSMASGRGRNRSQELPTGFTCVQDVRDGVVPAGSFTNVMGLIKDLRAPISTNRADWKCEMTIYDMSVQWDSFGLPINIFRPENEMPRPNAGDVIVVSSIKVQFYRNEFSLLTNYRTTIHTYSSSSIPRPPESAEIALDMPNRPKDRLPTDDVHLHVSWLYHSINKDNVPDTDTFNSKAEQSRHIKEKFSKLQDAFEGKFCDAIVHVVREPYNFMDKTTLWVSDYTENEKFYNFTWDGINAPSQGCDGDPYGYINTSNPAAKDWPGPYGRRSMQITCFEPHSNFVNLEVKAGKWIRLRNLQIKFGRNNNNLEGFLREDRMFNDRVYIDILDHDDPETIDARLKEAIKRKYDYEKLKKQQKKSYTANGGAGAKRKADIEEVKINAKSRRKAEREAKFRKVEEQEKQAEERLGLNQYIKCESPEVPITSVPDIIAPIPWTTTIDAEEITLTLPFANLRYRTNVRIVDFRPRKLEDFATWRQNTEYDILSDCSQDASSSSESDSDDDERQHQKTLDRYTGPKTWEWRFALLLEDADPKKASLKQGQPPPRLWALVDNTGAQQLTSLDATDLRAHPDDCAALREALFKLWGNLEEVKATEHVQQLQNRDRLLARQPPPSSPPPPSNTTGRDRHGERSMTAEVSNKPFACCIRQYGVKVRERDPMKADAGSGRKWVRMFGLFGTKISSVQ